MPIHSLDHAPERRFRFLEFAFFNARPRYAQPNLDRFGRFLRAKQFVVHLRILDGLIHLPKRQSQQRRIQQGLGRCVRVRRDLDRRFGKLGGSCIFRQILVIAGQ